MKNVLFIAPNWIGDAVMSLPALETLGAAPEARLTVCAGRYVARIYAGLPAVSELIVVERRGRLRRIAGAARLIGGLGADGAAILPPSFSSALTIFLARVPLRAGYAFDARGPLLNVTLPTREFKSQHLSERYLDLVRELLGRLRLPAPERSRTHPAIRIFEQDRNAAGAGLLESACGDARFCMVVPGATYGGAKTWPRECFRRLLEMLSLRMPVVLGGSAGERAVCEELGEGLAGVHNLSGRTSLGEFAALLAAAECVVANDSGAAHVAASVGAPVVVLFGSTSPRWTAPLGERVEIIQGAAPCSPCFKEECPTRLECFDAITPELVMKRAMDLVEKKGR